MPLYVAAALADSAFNYQGFDQADRHIRAGLGFTEALGQPSIVRDCRYY